MFLGCTLLNFSHVALGVENSTYMATAARLQAAVAGGSSILRFVAPEFASDKVTKSWRSLEGCRKRMQQQHGSLTVCASRCRHCTRESGDVGDTSLKPLIDLVVCYVVWLHCPFEMIPYHRCDDYDQCHLTNYILSNVEWAGCFEDIFQLMIITLTFMSCKWQSASQVFVMHVIKSDCISFAYGQGMIGNGGNSKEWPQALIVLLED